MSSLIKNATLYSMDLPNAGVLEEHFKEREFVDLLTGQMKTSGFIKATPDYDGIVLPLNGGFLFRHRIDAKSVPASLIAKERDKYLDEQEIKEPTKEQLEEASEQVTLELIARAFPKTTVTTCLYHTASGTLFVGSAVSGVCDIVTRDMVHAVKSIKTHTIHVSNLSHGLTARLHETVKLWNQGGLHVDTKFAPFDFCDSVQMRFKKGDGAAEKVSIASEGIHGRSVEIEMLLAAGFEVKSLGLFHEQTAVSFRFTDDFRLRAIKTDEEQLNKDLAEFEGEGDVDHDAQSFFESEATILLVYLSRVADSLIALFEYEKPGDDVPSETPPPADPADAEPTDDELYQAAVGVVVEADKASISLVQRMLNIGYNRAARLIEQMEANGVVSPMDESGVRTVLAGGDNE